MAEQKSEKINLVPTEKSKQEDLLAGLGIAYWEWRPNAGYYHSPEYNKYAISAMPDEQIWDSEAPFKFVHPDDIPLMKKFMQIFPEDEVKKSAVVRCKMSDGTYRWTEMFSFSETDEEGKLIRLVSAMRDVDNECIATHAAEQKNNELKRIIDAIAGGIARYTFADTFRLTAMSESLRKRLGYTAEDIEDACKKDALIYAHPADRALLMEKGTDVVKTGKPQIFAYRILEKKQTYKWFRAIFYYAGKEDGLDTLYEVLSDIGETNADYQEALNQTNEMVLIADWNTRDIIYLNNAAASMGNKPVAEFYGQKCSQIAQHCDKECPYCFKNDLTYDKLEIKTLSVGKRFFLSKGKRIMWNGREAFIEYVSDITAQQNMTEKAVFDRNLLSSATRSFFTMCAITNLTKNVYEFVEYERFGTEEVPQSGNFDNLIKNSLPTVHHEEREAFFAMFSRDSLFKAYKEGKKSVALTYRQYGEDGTPHWLRTTVVFADRLFDDELYTITFAYNVDKQKKDEAVIRAALSEAERANMAKTAFLSRVSHDMRTPLNGILGLASILKDRITDVEASRDLTELELSGKYLLNLINDTLDVSRIENGKLELNPTVCDGRDLFNNASKLVKTNAMIKNILLNIKAEDIPFSMLYVDSGRIEQVVLNIIGNAIKFSPQNGCIDITLENKNVENGVITDILKVRDYGIGMSKDFLPHIFEAFSQEDTARTNANQGTGLGMAITQQIVKLMGGKISVESELGKGTTFTVELKLPIATDEQIEAWNRSKISDDASIGLHDKKILLCEDHPLNTKIAKRLLEVKGMIADHAENGEIAVEMFKKSSVGYYDAILMDIRMPVMDGIDATKAIRALARRDAQYIPIIAMTANAFVDDIQQTKEAGMNAHLSKPIEPKILYSTLSEILKIDHSVCKQKVLIVDDSEVSRAVIKLSLEENYEILEAENGVQAFEIIKNTRGLDLVITDIQMPEMDGVELIKQIRSNADYYHIVIIANTQFGDLQQEEQLLSLGANDFIYKPTTPNIVKIRVRNALKKN